MRNALAAVRSVTSLSQMVGDDEETELGEILADPNSPDPAAIGEQSSLAEDVEYLLTCLTAREREVIVGRFGLGETRRKPLAELGTELGISRERVRQIEAEAMAKLKRVALRRKLKSWI